MNRDQRVEWVRRGFKDPVAAFRMHISNAKQRGIPFRMTFEQWWALWEPHYEKRGTGEGQMCMCRTHDQGAYEAGNVRIDFNKSNLQEAAMLKQSGKAATAFFPNREKYRPNPAGSGTWLIHNRFAPYVEEDVDDDI